MIPAARRAGSGSPGMTTVALWGPWMAWRFTGATVLGVVVQASGLMYVNPGAMIVTAFFLPLATFLLSILFSTIDWVLASYSRRDMGRRVGEIYRSPVGLALLLGLTLSGYAYGRRVDILESDAPSRNGYRQPSDTLVSQAP